MQAIDFFKEYPEAEETLRIALKDIAIRDISPLSMGATNHSFIVDTPKGEYILRVPGKDSESFIDRRQEKEIYERIAAHHLSDDVIYLNPENGHKLSAYFADSRLLDPANQKDMRLFLKTVRELHELNLNCGPVYDFFENIPKYEARSKTPRWFDDYAEVRRDIFSLKRFAKCVEKEFCLIHNDLSPENCLLVRDAQGREKCILIDFEYAAMQAPMADLAYFCVFSNLSEAQVEAVINVYFDGEPPVSARLELYGFIALNGLLHCNWLGMKSVADERKEEARQVFLLAKRYYGKANEMLEGSLCQE